MELLVDHLQDHIRKLPEEKQVLDQEEETSDDSVDIFIKSILPGYFTFLKNIYCFHYQHIITLGNKIKCSHILVEKQSQALQLLKISQAKKVAKKNKVNHTNINNLGLGKGLNPNPFISNRTVEAELISNLYKINSTKLSKMKTGPLFGSGRTSNFKLFENDCSIIKTVEKDLINIMSQAVKSEVCIMNSFLNILGAGGGSVPHTHISNFDKMNGLSNQKYSLQYYISVGDQNCSEPGILKIYDPEEEILPSEGTIVIFPADRSHSVAYRGKIDRVMIGVNFYSLI